MNNEKYFLGLDIGTDSVGYAATNTEYELLNFKGEPVWGVHIFEEASLAAERRTARTARRRLDRVQARVALINDIFAKSITEIDPRYFIRRQESFLHRDDTEDEHTLFDSHDYSDTEFYKDYPTIHHLLVELMNNDQPHDIRLVHIACAWLVAHRGHFLNPVDKDNVEGLTDFNFVVDDFADWLTSNGYQTTYGDFDWRDNDCKSTIYQVMTSKGKISNKANDFKKFLFQGKYPVISDDEFPFDLSSLFELLAGKQVKLNKLYTNQDLSGIEKPSVSLKDDDESFAELLSQLDDNADLLNKLRAIFDCASLSNVLSGSSSISEAKKKVYEQHKEDLKYLKEIVIKYAPEEYFDIFKSDSIANNYVAWSYNVKSCKNPEKVKKTVNSEDFCKFIKSKISNLEVDDSDTAQYKDMMQRLEDNTFMPKQRISDNRILPYQLYYYELQKILQNAAKYIPLLNEKYDDGTTGAERILSVFTYRIPYYVGPLNKHSKNSWIERKNEKIYPWNFDKVVDLDASEQAFIKRMTNTCTYIADKPVLPKNSILYSKFMVLNEINNITINEVRISPKCKQEIYNTLFAEKPRVTVKQIKGFLISNNYMTESDTIGGIDVSIKSSMKPLIAFRRMIRNGIIDENQAEEIINRATYSEDKNRFCKWLSDNFGFISEEDRKYISRLSFKDFGRLSEYFLTQVMGVDKQSGTGECFSIIDALWNTDCNLMQLLSDRFTFAEEIQRINDEYYQTHKENLSERLDSMYVSNAVKRQIIRSLDVTSDVVKAIKKAPQKIFIEMARGGTPEQKGKRTKTRFEQIKELYANCEEDTRELERQLDDLGELADNKLQSDRLFLYYLQLGRSMYTGLPIDVTKIAGSTYNIEHIYPRALVKDDSIINNEVLVESEVNGQKSDSYPISSEIRSSMYGFWHSLHSHNLISDEKFRRLTRSTGFSDDEKWGFINRQLVETRQSTKVIAELLKEKYPETEIVYVKAGLVSDFRQQYDMLKSRVINDLHHAKDAYLNIVVGNVYNMMFTKKWFYSNKNNYSIKIETIFGKDQSVDGTIVWDGKKSHSVVRNTMNNNHIHLTEYEFVRKGTLFDLMPLKAGSSDQLVPLKKGLEIAKYGGYNKPTASFFVLLKYSTGKKKDIAFIPIDLMNAERFKNDSIFANEYAKTVLEGIIGKTITNSELLYNGRLIKINTVISLDGYRMTISGKANGGKRMIVSSQMPLMVSYETERYIKKLEAFQNKTKLNPRLIADSLHDGITKEQNEHLYEYMITKLENKIYSKRPANPAETLKKGKNKFIGLDINAQVNLILNLITVFGRMSGGCDLSLVNGAPHAAATMISSSVSTIACTYSDVRIIDASPSGLYEKSTGNLLDML